ncbi:interferon-stimulated 20 kDa exonuclease-like 2 [Polyodon spathula]|uniref:interferon-stimulated 20 kDa exonuclease-like 2 n=1 Tax=Polyodon spathula TaxID=7913 RepID=UPI001B7F7059|nr:interferon-stimulated 20 kDa exonuclease-like 2 [Polyodon spathula]XP_041098947.1 interferon-stimulated 20 kDa exonuclease-like 2 [Polyodon spathula]
MSDLILNLDLSGASRGRPKDPSANARHQRFLKKRKFLENKGYLRQKQLPGPGRGQGSSKNRQPWHNDGPQSHGSSTGRPQASFRGSGCAPGAQRQPAVGAAPSRARPGPGPSALNADLLGEFESGLSSLPALSSSSTAGKTYKYLAMDCEMVGTGPRGTRSELARCSIVGYHGDVVYDKYILPTNPVTDYRTCWSGIRKQDLANATGFKEAQKEILKILSGKVVIGHAIHNDFKALGYFHPPALTRDTSRIPLLNKKAGIPAKEAVSLKRLTKMLFRKDIQVGKNGHSSVEDARATMELYKIVEPQWERTLASGSEKQSPTPQQRNGLTGSPLPIPPSAPLTL